MPSGFALDTGPPMEQAVVAQAYRPRLHVGVKKLFLYSIPRQLSEVAERGSVMLLVVVRRSVGIAMLVHATQEVNG